MQLAIFKDDCFVPVKYIVCVRRWDFDPKNHNPNYPEPENKYYVKVSFTNDEYVTTGFKTEKERDEWYDALMEVLSKAKD